MSGKKVAVISGANRGLGLATASELAREGYSVVMLARDLSKLKNSVKTLSDEGFDIYPFELDVTNDAHVKELGAFLDSQFGRVDILINNAGAILESSDPTKPGEASAQDVSPKVVMETFNINTLGPLRLCQAILPIMKKNDFGRIVNVSSGMGQLADMNGSWPGYRLSKTALNALTRTLAAELTGTNIKINSVCPGWVRTDMGGPSAERSVEEGISGILWAAKLDDDGPSGGFFRDEERIDW